MTIDDIEKRIQAIRGSAADYENAHAIEDQLHRDFIAYIATRSVPHLAEKAALVLTTDAIDFPRREDGCEGILETPRARCKWLWLASAVRRLFMKPELITLYCGECGRILDTTKPAAESDWPRCCGFQMEEVEAPKPPDGWLINPAYLEASRWVVFCGPGFPSIEDQLAAHQATQDKYASP
jgi:hypothetical protein